MTAHRLSVHSWWGSPAAGMRVLLSGRDHRAPPRSTLSAFQLLQIPPALSNKKRGGGAFPAPPGRQADYSRSTTPPCVKAGIKSKLTASILLLHLLRPLLRLLTPSASPPAVHWFGAAASIPPRAVGVLHAWPCAVVLRLKCWGTETFFPWEGRLARSCQSVAPIGQDELLPRCKSAAQWPESELHVNKNSCKVENFELFGELLSIFTPAGWPSIYVFIYLIAGDVNQKYQNSIKVSNLTFPRALRWLALALGFRFITATHLFTFVLFTVVRDITKSFEY